MLSTILDGFNDTSNDIAKKTRENTNKAIVAFPSPTNGAIPTSYETAPVLGKAKKGPIVK